MRADSFTDLFPVELTRSDAFKSSASNEERNRIIAMPLLQTINARAILDGKSARLAPGPSRLARSMETRFLTSGTMRRPTQNNLKLPLRIDGT